MCPVLLSPEHLQHWKRVILALAAADLLGPAVFDEAHCISVWGRKFRHAYMQLSLYKSHVRLRSLACLVRCRILCIVHLVQADVVALLWLVPLGNRLTQRSGRYDGHYWC